MKKILVTGGCGYIGGHTIVDLATYGYEVISIDNLSRGSNRMLDGINAILQKKIINYEIDLCNLELVREVFEEHNDIEGIIHFAAFKSVPESVEKPLLYYYNNNNALINILQCCKEFGVRHFIFSSSCSVYGNADHLPVTEQTRVGAVASPYAATKVMGEQICRDFHKVNKPFNITLLRYFNPVGAHPSALIGEMNKVNENLVPIITQTAIGERASMSVYGSDYATRDGSCIRDYIHVMDIAHAHTLALGVSMSRSDDDVSLFNLGTGDGVSVLELISSFEKVSNTTLNYKVEGRRAGDVAAIYADNSLAKQVLGWNPTYTIDDMMHTAWEWQKALSNNSIQQ